MASLQDQLLKAGLIDTKKAKQAKNEKRIMKANVLVARGNGVGSECAALPRMSRRAGPAV